VHDGFDFAELINADMERAMPTMTMINPDVTAHVLRPPPARGSR
jgi:hypothetical protein